MVTIELDKAFEASKKIQVYVKFNDSNGNLISTGSVSGNTKDEIKDKLRPILKRIRDENIQAQQLKDVTIQAINELNEEDLDKFVIEPEITEPLPDPEPEPEPEPEPDIEPIEPLDPPLPSKGE